MMKKVILILVDSLMPSTLEDGFRHRSTPALQFLMEKGRYWPNCVTVFPTMTASVDSSLLTGVYPDQHRVPGLIWYDPHEKEMVNYINGWKCVWKLGLHKCIQHVLYDLNEKHLSKQVTTLFEELALRGRTSASINAAVHRGNKWHSLNLPLLIKLVTRFRFRRSLSGPDILTLGRLVHHHLHAQLPKKQQGLFNRYGNNDAYAVQLVQQLITSKQQPDFTLVYLPDHDHELHKHSPAHAEESLIKVDKHIQYIFNSFSSWDQALKKCVFIVTSDHGQTSIGQVHDSNIDLDLLFQEFKVYQLGGVVDNQDVVVCNNERMTYIYPLKDNLEEKVLATLFPEARIDLIAWKRGEGVVVRQGGAGKEIYYQPNGSIEDIYGVKWHIEGDYSTLDLSIDGKTLNYGDYPDALARLYGALYSQDIPMIVITARPRCQFKSRYHPSHLNGGSHGSLHKYDSVIPLIVAGTEHSLPQHPRLVDLKEYILTLFDQG